MTHLIGCSTLALDASVVIAFLDADDALHARATRAHAGDDLVFPASAYAEAMVMPCRHGAGAPERLERFVDDFAVGIAPIERTIARLAARLRARHRALRLPDALVLATGEALNADHVVTGEAGWARWSRRVRGL